MVARTNAEGHDTRSYAFFIERLLPTHRLTTARRQTLQTALATDDPQAMYAASVAALADLQAEGLFEELPPPRASARVFRHRGRGDWLLLETPRGRALQASRPNGLGATPSLEERPPRPQARVVIPDEFSDRERPAPEPSGATDSQAVEPRIDAGSFAADFPSAWPGEAADAAPTAVRASAAAGLEAPIRVAEAWPHLEPFLDLASIEPQLEPFGDRLRRIVTQLEAALPGATARLLVLDPESAEGLGDGAVHMLDRAAAEDVPHYREALRKGETQFATSAPVGADPASGRIAAAVPLYVSSTPWGLLRITWDQGCVASVPELARILTPLARLVAVAIQNQTMLEKLVFVDPLTGVYNRAFYDRQVTLEIERANRTNQKLGLLVMDIDDFKAINDQFGHRAGDQVLAQVAREVRARMRKIDLMFRYGGEEFVLLLPGADLEEAQRTAERLRLVVGEQRVLPDGVATPLRVTVSVGGAVYPDQSRTKTGLFNAADSALYRAKNDGKNRVAF